MTTPRDDEADDRFVDHLLAQEFSGRVPPDLSDRVAAALPARRAAAARRVDEALAGSQRSNRRAPLLFAAAAAALLLVGLGAFAAGAFDARPATDVVGEARHLLDEFHRAMPPYPSALRDARRRRAVAPRALPVIHAILALHRDHPDERVFGDRVVEFEAYAAMLGDEQVLAHLRERRDDGDAAAEAALLATRVATGTGDARAAALDGLVAVVQRAPETAPLVARSLDVAELEADEVALLLAVSPEPRTRAFLRRSAERAEASPRRLLGQRLRLDGATVDGRSLDDASLRGRPVLVCFWASWCVPSLAELERIRDVHRRHPELAVVTVSSDHEYAAVRNYVADHGDDEDWTHLFDRARPGHHELAFAARVRALPLTLLLDRDGNVHAVDVGADAEVLEQAVRELLGR